MTIDDYIPHRGPMRLVDRLVSADDEQAVVEAEVPAAGAFVQQRRMPSYVLIEHMAQSVAAWAGARARRQGRPVPLGFLLGTRRFEASCDELPSGTRLRMTVRCEMLGDNGLGMFDCRVDADGRTVAQAMLSVFEPPDAQAFLRGSAS